MERIDISYDFMYDEAFRTAFPERDTSLFRSMMELLDRSYNDDYRMHDTVIEKLTVIPIELEPERRYMTFMTPDHWLRMMVIRRLYWSRLHMDDLAGKVCYLLNQRIGPRAVRVMCLDGDVPPWVYDDFRKRRIEEYRNRRIGCPADVPRLYHDYRFGGFDLVKKRGYRGDIGTLDDLFRKYGLKENANRPRLINVSGRK